MSKIVEKLKTMSFEDIEKRMNELLSHPNIKKI